MNVNKITASIVAYVVILSGAVLGAAATSQAATPAHTVTHTQPAPTAANGGNVDDYRDDLAYFVGQDVANHVNLIVTDNPLLNCGSAHSFEFTGGGCTLMGGTSHAVLIVSPTADDHVLMHEYAHYRYGVGECAAERFANTITQTVEWSYPSCRNSK